MRQEYPGLDNETTTMVLKSYGIAEPDSIIYDALVHGVICQLRTPNEEQRYFWYDYQARIFVITDDPSAFRKVREDGMSIAETWFCERTDKHQPHIWWSYEPDPSARNQYVPCRCPGHKYIVVPGQAMDDWEALKRGARAVEENKTLKGNVNIEPDPNDPNTYRRAAERFLTDCGLPPVPDAVDQLAEAFLPALQIICERGYHPEGNTWREAGWRGILTDIKKKANRLWYRSWVKGGFDDDSARDIINFAGFYLRLGNQGKEWGEWGDPSSVGPAPRCLLGSHAEGESTQWLSPAEWNAQNKELDIEPPEVAEGIVDFRRDKAVYRKIKDNPQA